MSDEPLYCPACGKENCSCPLPDELAPGQRIYCEICGAQTAPDGPCEACDEIRQDLSNEEAHDENAPFGNEEVFA
jgi:hypothetical protein